jgi:chemotaxis signal transduction protein
MRDASQYLIFRCGHARYAIELARVLQVIEEQELEPVPGAPGPCLGVVSHYGRLIAVFEGRPILSGGGPEVPDGGDTLETARGFPVWLVMRSEDYSVAVRVDGVESISEIGNEWSTPEEAKDGLVDALWRNTSGVVNRIDPHGLLQRIDSLF